MEERAVLPPPATATATASANGTSVDDPPLQLKLQILPPEPTPERPLETYIIQIPKEQIYRVPPPENALIVEQYRKKPGKKSKPSCPIHKLLVWSAIALAAIGVVLGIMFLAIYASNTPKAPTFSVSNVTVKKSAGGKPPTYDVKLKVRNTDSKMGVLYGTDEDASFHFGKRMVALGTFKEMSQMEGESTVVHVMMTGMESVPPAVSQSLADKKTKHKLVLVLDITASAKFNIGALKMWKRNIDVKCNVQLSTLGADGKVLSEKCRTNLS